MLELQFAHIHAVHEHATVSDVVKARDQADQSRFAGGGRPDDSDGLAGFAFEAHLGKRGFAVAVIETDLLEIDAPEVIKLAFAAPDVLRFVDYFENALGAGAGVLDDAGELTDHPDPVADGHQIKHHLRQIAEGQAAPNDLSAADPKHERQTQAEDELRERHARGPVVHRFEERGKKEFLAVAELFCFGRFHGEGLDHPHAGDVFLDDGGHGAVEVMNFAPLGLEPAGEKGNERDGRNERQ